MMSRLRHLRSITLNASLCEGFPVPVPHGAIALPAKLTRVVRGERPLDYGDGVVHAADRRLVLGRTPQHLAVCGGPDHRRQHGQRGDG